MTAAATSSNARVQSYLASLPAAVRAELERIREAVRAAAPGAVEAFSYGMPAFTLDGRPLVWYAGWKRHLSLYPMSAAIRQAHAAEVGAHGGTKGTIRFPLAEPPSSALVQRLVEARIAELRAEASARATVG